MNGWMELESRKGKERMGERYVRPVLPYVPVTSAVVVAMAGVIFPAIPRAVWRSASGIL